jgi:hypothetical protein
VYQFVQKYGLDEDFQQSRIYQLVELDEIRRKALDQSIKNRDKVKRTFDKSLWQRVFQEGDTVLLWDKRREKPGNHGKFDSYGQVHTSYKVQLTRIYFISTGWMVRSWPFHSTANFSSFSSQRSSDAHGGIYCIIL